MALKAISTGFLMIYEWIFGILILKKIAKADAHRWEIEGW